MAMFVHKPKDEDQEDSPPPAQEAAQEPPPPPPVSPLPQTEGESGDEDEGDDSSGQSGNPMSFFKKGD